MFLGLPRSTWQWQCLLRQLSRRWILALARASLWVKPWCIPIKSWNSDSDDD